MGDAQFHHKIVALDPQFYSVPEFDLPNATYEIASHEVRNATDVARFIQDATIVIAPVLVLGAEALSERNAPQLQFISWVASGTDTLDLEACKRRGIKVSNGAQANTQAVSEHAIGFYFAVRRRVMQSHLLVRSRGGWNSMRDTVNLMRGNDGLLPLSCSQEVLGIVGYGSIGE